MIQSLHRILRPALTLTLLFLSGKNLLLAAIDIGDLLERHTTEEIDETINKRNAVLKSKIAEIRGLEKEKASSVTRITELNQEIKSFNRLDNLLNQKIKNREETIKKMTAILKSRSRDASGSLDIGVLFESDKSDKKIPHLMAEIAKKRKEIELLKKKGALDADALGGMHTLFSESALAKLKQSLAIVTKQNRELKKLFAKTPVKAVIPKKESLDRSSSRGRSISREKSVRRGTGRRNLLSRD